MPTYLTPGVYYEAVDTSQEGIAGIRTDIAALVGIAEQGPMHVPTRVNSWEQFQSAFGNFIPGGYLAYGAKAFFENGGQSLYVVRVASQPETTTDPAAAQPATRDASIVVSVDGFTPGATVLVRQDPDLQIGHVLQDVDTVNRKLIWAQPLEAALDITQPIEFDTGALAARAVLLDGAGKPTLRIQASSEGTWANAVSVFVSHSSPAATATRNITQPATRLSSYVASVSGFAPGALVKVYQAQPAVLTKYHIVTAVDAGLRLITWDAALEVGFDLTQPLYFETLEFGLSVYQGRVPREIFSGLSLVPTHARYIGKVITADSSHLITVTDLVSPSPFPDRLPDPGAPNLAHGWLRLQWGQDGLAALTPLDFTGDPTIDAKWGLRTLEDVDEVAIVGIPDILIQPAPPVSFAPQPPPAVNPCLPCTLPPPVAPAPPPQVYEQPPTFTLDDVFAVQQALVTHCETQADRIALLDAPVFGAVGETLDIGEIMSWRQRFDSKYAALYYPWLLVEDPLQLGGEVVRAIPPSGHVAGVYANTDVTVGVFKAPANTPLAWAQDVTTPIDAPVQGLLNPLGINCIRSFSGRGLRVYGARTVSSDTDWIYVNVRRLMMMIEKAVNLSIQWSVFEPNDFYLRQKIRLAIGSFLTELWKRGALVGASAEQAFYIQCDEKNNPPAVTDLGQMIAQVGVAPVKPAEFVVFRIGRTGNTLEMTE